MVSYDNALFDTINFLKIPHFFSERIGSKIFFCKFFLFLMKNTIHFICFLLLHRLNSNIEPLSWSNSLNCRFHLPIARLENPYLWYPLHMYLPICWQFSKNIVFAVLRFFSRKAKTFCITLVGFIQFFIRWFESFQLKHFGLRSLYGFE